VFVVANVITSVISGGIFPLDIFGDKFLAVFHLLPFQYTIYFPVNILNGVISFEEILNELMIQSLWIMIMLVIANITWKFGMKKYTAAGG
jgi:ABC-2 type transport system permease protein